MLSDKLLEKTKVLMSDELSSKTEMSFLKETWDVEGLIEIKEYYWPLVVIL